MSSPTDTPKATASLVAASADRREEIVRQLECLGHAGLPTHATAAVAQTGQHRRDGVAHRRRTPAYITESVRARAPATPPETGAST